MEPITQPQNPVENTNTNANANPGVEARIAELVAQRGEVERKYAELEKRNAELQLRYETTANAVAASLGVPGVETKPNIDPNLKAAVESVMGPMLAEFRQAIGGVRYAEHQRSLNESFTQLNVPEPVRKRALEIQAEYAKAGNFLKPEIARRYAWGEIAEQEAAKAAQANAQRTGFNHPYANLGNGAQIPLHPQTTVEKPANFDSLSTREQVLWYEKNIGDRPL